MSVVFTQARDREVVEVYKQANEDSCGRCLTKGQMVSIAIAKMEFTLCDNCFHKLLDEMARHDATTRLKSLWNKLAKWRKKTI